MSEMQFEGGPGIKDLVSFRRHVNAAERFWHAAYNDHDYDVAADVVMDPDISLTSLCSVMGGILACCDQDDVRAAFEDWHTNISDVIDEVTGDA